jgi:hypothetical protein
MSIVIDPEATSTEVERRYRRRRPTEVSGRI